MDGFTPGDLGFVAAWCVGGPLDGRGYADMPLFPNGLPGSKVSIPTPDGRLTYVRRAEVGADGRWCYDYAPSAQGLIAGFPTGTSLAA